MKSIQLKRIPHGYVSYDERVKIGTEFVGKRFHTRISHFTLEVFYDYLPNSLDFDLFGSYVYINNNGFLLDPGTYQYLSGYKFLRFKILGCVVYTGSLTCYRYPDPEATEIKIFVTNEIHTLIN